MGNSWGFFRRIFWEEYFGSIFLEDFFGGFFLEDFFWRNFLGGIFWEDFFGRNYSVEINKELIFLSRFGCNFVSMEKEGRRKEGRNFNP